MRYTISKPAHGSQEWLNARWADEDGFKRVTASVAAAVHGEHRFTTAGDLAAELLAVFPPEPKEQNDAMRRGNILEGPLMRWAGELLGVKISEPDRLFCFNDQGARMLATIDGMDEAGNVYEIKTYARRWDGELPRYWYWQGVQQAVCCDVNKITWVVFDSSLQLHFHEQTVTSDEKQEHIGAVARFLSSIDLGMVPDVAELSLDNVQQIYPKAVSGVIRELGEKGAEIVARLSAAKEQKRLAEEAEDKAKAELGLLLEDCENGTVNGVQVVTWKQTSRKSFDTKRFEAEHPALAAKFKKETTFRTMRIVNKEEN